MNSYFQQGISTGRYPGYPVSTGVHDETTQSGKGSENVLTSKNIDSKLPYTMLLVFTFILYISPQSSISALAPLHIALLSAGISVISYLYDRFTQRQAIVKFSREIVIILCLVWWVIFTLPLSYWLGGSIDLVSDRFIKTLMVFWLVSHVINTLPRLNTFIWFLAIISVPIAFTAIINLLAGEYIGDGSGSRILGYNAPLTSNPNDLALTLNLFLPLMIAIYQSTSIRSRRVVLLGIICLNIAAIIATFSRAGFLTLAVIFAAQLWMLYKRNKWHLALLALFVPFAALPFLPSGYLERLSTITEIESDPTGSAQIRWRDTVAAVRYINEHPVIGAGIGMDRLAMNEERGETWTEVHNAYLQYGVDLGIPGLVLFIMLLVSSIKSTKSVRYRIAGVKDAVELCAIADGIRISLIAFSVAAFFHPVAYHIYFFFIAGLGLAAKYISISASVNTKDATWRSTPVCVQNQGHNHA